MESHPQEDPPRWSLSALSKRSSDPFRFASGLTGVDQTGNFLWTDVLLVTFGCIVALTLLVRFARMYNNHIRHVSVMGTQHKQAYWRHNQTQIVPWLKQHFIYAPIFKKKKNDEIKLGTVGLGTLPSRFHLVLILIYTFSNVAYCLALPWGRANSASVAAALRGRSGTLAALNLIPTILFALRNNPLIWMLHVSYDTFNLLHRWAARIVIVESVVHTLCWLLNTYNAGTKWAGVRELLGTTPSYQWGTLGTVAFVVLGVQAWSPVRHAFYETFLNVHRLMVVCSIVGLYLHIDLHQLPQLPWVKLAFSLWICEWIFRTWKLVRYNVSVRGLSKVTIEAMPSEAVRVTIDLVRPWYHRPGSHVHLYVPSIGGWSSHPFSVAWATPSAAAAQVNFEDEKLGLPTTERSNHKDLTRPHLPMRSIGLVCRAREGFTRSMYDRACKQPNGILTTTGMIEGPYGGHESLDSYGTVILFAAGVGITHQTSYVRHLVAGYHAGSLAARKVVLVWTIPSTECLEWVRPWMDEILRMPGRRECLRILLFITRPRNHAEINSSSGSVQMFPGRCDVQTIVDREIEERTGAVAVTVCGAGAFSDGVREAVRKRVDEGSIDYIEEAFTY
ncbi:ferric reductase like transmembrane component-domain-containing protein [Phyllosticta citrichinensis]|uniref:Ferric reductase like transmembrane component-domain-containing protein n=1 Tax=Phyllosticta citrichinensis TaxID=1130410 RepID=A0ABR1Y771_9PEZI